jgi:hypothetical protein
VRLAVGVLAVLTASCGARLMKLPTGVGAAAPDFLAATAQAMSACESLKTMTAEIAVSGSVAGHRLRARLLGGFTSSAARLEAVAPAGPPFFIFVANKEDATLLLPREDRVIEHGRSDAVLEAIAGVRIGPAGLFEALTGCVVPRWRYAERVGDTWRIGTTEDGVKLYLHRDSTSTPWQAAAMLSPGIGQAWSWRADYRDIHGGLPRSVSLVSADRHQFSLQLTLSQVETGVPLEADVFRVRIPPSAQPIALEELRQSGPFARRP